MKTLCILAVIVGALAGCQSGGGTASLNSGYSGAGNCSSYDYANTGSGPCIGWTWR
jgi:hypothetical protein